MKNTKRIGRFNNHSDNNNSNSPSYFNQLASFYRDIGWKPSLDRSRSLSLRHRRTSFGKVLEYADNRIQKSQKFFNKIKSRELACANRAKVIPENATIRKEYIKCKKANCHHDHHGPYYYAYWKDPQTKKLNKKYIGRSIQSLFATLPHAAVVVLIN